MSIDATKPWWASKTIWAGIASILLGLGSLVFGWAVTPTDIADAAAQLYDLLTAILGLLAIVGRLTADKRIG